MADSTSSGLQVDLLGAVQVTVDGRRLDIGGPKPRAVVAALALAAGTPVPPVTLAAALWGATPPPAAAGTLRAYGSRLRAVLGGELLQRSAAGYVLGVAPAAVDALVFEQCVRSHVDSGSAAWDALANPQSSRDLQRVEEELLAALRLWRGPALEDLRGLPLARAEARRLEELRLEAWEAVLDLRLRRGAEAQVLRDLAPLLTRNPLRERLHAQRMVALYRSGRQTEALEAYARVRRQLAAERGLDPGPALQEVHRQVLEQDPSLLGSGPAAGSAERALPSAPPSSVTRFVGRNSDVERVLACLATDRLVTLVGPGGGGKTRLALEVARRRAVTAPDPVLVVELAGVRDARHVLHAVAAALGPGTSVEPSPAALAAVLRGTAALLVLDNCEHLLDAAADTATALLGACPEVRVLATSRQVLGVPGELAVELAPLAVGDGDVPGDAELLFLDRARVASGGMTYDDPADLPVVRDICRALDGLPLAIELAAARTRALSLTDVLAGLDDRSRFLAAADRYQRGLLGAVSWSVDSLDAVQREMLLSVSMFASGFELDAARAVSGRGDDVVDVLSALVDRSLLTLDRAAQPRRYLMLETLREYVQMQADPAQMRAARAAHARFFTGLAEQLSARLRTAGSGSAWQRMARESNDIRISLSWWLEQGDARTALRTATAMSWFWYRRSHVGEARRALEQTLDAAAHLTPDIDRARALLALGWMHYLTGGEQVLSHLQEAARLAEEAADDVTLASALVWSAYVHAFAGQHDQAHAAVERSLRLAEHSGPPWLVAEGLLALGLLLRLELRQEAAAAALARAEQASLEAGHLWAAGAAAWLAGNVALDGDDADGATEVLLRSLGHAEGDMSSTLIGLQSLAGALAAQGRAEIGAEVLGAVAAAAPAAGFDPESIGGAAGTRSRRLVVERLEPDAFARAWERGLRLTPAEAARRVTPDAT